MTKVVLAGVAHREAGSGEDGGTTGTTHLTCDSSDLHFRDHILPILTNESILVIEGIHHLVPLRSGVEYNLILPNVSRELQASSIRPRIMGGDLRATWKKGKHDQFFSDMRILRVYLKFMAPNLPPPEGWDMVDCLRSGKYEGLPQISPIPQVRTSAVRLYREWRKVDGYFADKISRAMRSTNLVVFVGGTMHAIALSELHPEWELKILSPGSVLTDPAQHREVLLYGHYLRVWGQT